MNTDSNSKKVEKIFYDNSLYFDSIADKLVKALNNIYTPKIIDSIANMQNSIAKIITNESFNNALVSSLEKINILNDRMQNVFTPTFFDSLNSSIVSLGKALNNINDNYLNAISKAIDTIDFEKFEIYEDYLKYDDETITTNDINITINYLENTSVIGNNIDKKSITIIAFLLWFITTFFTGLISKPGSDLYDYLVNTYFTSEKAQISDSKSFCNEYCKLIVELELDVKNEPSSDSRIIGKLYYLNIVKEIEKKPYWTKVEYRNSENGTLIIGWVATKHLKSLNINKSTFEDSDE